MSEKHAFLWLPSWDETLDLVAKNNPEKAWQLFLAIRAYGENAELIPLDWELEAIFRSIKYTIDGKRKEYERKVERSRKAGRRSFFDREAIKDCLAEGLTPKEVAEKYGCTERRVRQIQSSIIEETSAEIIGNNRKQSETIGNNSEIRNNGNNIDDKMIRCIDDKMKRWEDDKSPSLPPNFCHDIYSLYQDAHLPLPKSGEVGFMQYDMKIGLERFVQQGVKPADVIEAVKNYIRVISLGENTWYHSRLSFADLMKQTNLVRFIPDRFDMATYNHQKVSADEYTGGDW